MPAPKKDEKELVTKNIRVTEDAHEFLSTMADMLDTTLSGAIEYMRKAFPEVDAERERRISEQKRREEDAEALRRRLEGKKP